MRTTLKSEKTLYLLIGLFFASLFLALSIVFMPKTFASEEENEEEDYSIVSDNHFVTIYDGDSKRTVHTKANTVGEILDRLKINLSDSDSVSPSVETEIDSNTFFINIYRSHPILVLDGAVSKVANVSSFDTITSVRSAGFMIYDSDTIEIVPANNFLEAGITTAYKIIRGSGETATIEEDIPFETKTIKDYDIPEGAEKVQQLGELGKVKKTYHVKTVNGEIVEKELISEEIVRNPVDKVVAIGSPKVSASALTASKGRNRYTSTNLSGQTVERQETFYDLPMSVVMSYCGKTGYTVREDGVKVDDEGYVIVAAELSRYPRCSVVETSLGKGKVYDTGGFAATNPEQFDLATDWTNRDGI